MLKTLEKDRTRRYETASELAMDIERHLKDEPVAAGPPGAGYRLCKFVRRHRTGVLFAFLLVTVLVIGLSVSMIGFVQASRERNRAEANFQTARDTMYEMIGVVDYDLFFVPDSEQVRRKLLEKAQVFYAKFVEENRDDPASIK